jgi:hypothetical protein
MQNDSTQKNIFSTSEVIILIEKLSANNFWGHAVLYFQDGKICACETRQTMKKGDTKILTL